jgi:hypothetical protein
VTEGSEKLANLSNKIDQKNGDTNEQNQEGMRGYN